MLKTACNHEDGDVNDYNGVDDKDHHHHCNNEVCVSFTLLIYGSIFVESGKGEPPIETIEETKMIS